MKIYTLRAAVKSVSQEEIVEEPKKQAAVYKEDPISKPMMVMLIGLMILVVLMVWWVAAQLSFGVTYASHNSSKKMTCETCSACPVHQYNRRGELQYRTYYNKNRVTPREFNARFWGAMFFQKYPELEEQAKPEWTLNKNDLNEPYHKWAVKPKTRGWYHPRRVYATPALTKIKEQYSVIDFRGDDLTDPCESLEGCSQTVHFFSATKNSRHRGAR